MSKIININDLIDAQVHIGHRKSRTNPKMLPYIYEDNNTKKADYHTIDLRKTVHCLKRMLKPVQDTAADMGRFLFVGTKPQAAEPIKQAALACGQYYINHRWLGGTLTNWATISSSIATLENMEKKLADENSMLTKQEIALLEKKKNKLALTLDGIRNMGGLPTMIFVIDTNKEHVAIKEAKKLGIAIAAVVDTNSNPEDIDYPIPGNDDSAKAIKLYCDLMAETIAAGIYTDLESASSASSSELDSTKKRGKFKPRASRHDKDQESKGGEGTEEQVSLQQ